MCPLKFKFLILDFDDKYWIERTYYIRTTKMVLRGQNVKKYAYSHYIYTI